MILAHGFLGWGKQKPAATADSKAATPPSSGQN